MEAIYAPMEMRHGIIFGKLFNTFQLDSLIAHELQAATMCTVVGLGGQSWMGHCQYCSHLFIAHIHYTDSSNFQYIIIVSCPDIHTHWRRTSGGLSEISCHRGVSSVGIIEVLIVLRMQLSEKFAFRTIYRVTLHVPSSSL